MTYQVLARKWRPQDFATVVGQQPIVTALSNALAESRVAQAYLFSGIRGVGKTSVARIFAKALNCEQGPTATPCGKCPSCTEIEAGTNLMDVIEVDAATYSKVEQVRELTESLKYGPARDRYKVVILDEIHRLSRQAFDALLKIVEEPPPHLVFIFATTEIESVPATILSRCQEFRFRRVAFDELVTHLDSLARAEEIEVGNTALRLIARASDGSVRDAVALLDQLATFGSGTIDDDDAAGVLGGVDPKLFHNLLESILAGRSVDVSATIHEIESEGWDPRYVFTEFLQYCRSALHLALGAEADHLDLPREESRSLATLVESAGYENLLRLLHLLLGSEETVRRSESGLLAVEIAWLRGAELPKLVAIEELLRGAPTTQAADDEAPSRPTSKRPVRSRPKPAPGKSPSNSQPGPPSSSPSKSPPKSSPKSPPKSNSDHGGRSLTAEAPSAPAAPPAKEPPAPAPAPTPENRQDATLDSPDAAERFLGLVSAKSQALAAHLSGALGLEHSNGELRIRVVSGDTWIRDRLGQEKHRATLESAIASTWSEPAVWRIVEEDVEPKAEGPGPEAAVDDPQVQKILDIFGGSVESGDDDS